MVSIFARWRPGHQATPEQSSKGPSAFYRHVPTHALSDALAGVPGSYRVADHGKIRGQQRQRSAQGSVGGPEIAVLVPTSRSSSYVGIQSSGSPAFASTNERTTFKRKAHLRTERGESYPSRSRLSFVGMYFDTACFHPPGSSFTETSPHISGVNSESSVRLSSSQQSSSMSRSDSPDHL